MELPGHSDALADAGQHHQHHHHRHRGHAHGARGARHLSSLALSLGLTAAYMFAEAIGGLLTGSLALLADAGHMLSDAGALALSLFAMWIAQRPASAQRTYGYYRSEILAALIHGATLITVAILVVLEAVERLSAPQEVEAPVMLVIAVGGLAVNGLSLWVLSAGKSDSLNVRGAWLHVLTDALGSIGVIISAVLVWAFDFWLADPIASLLISALVVYSSYPLLKQTVAILMESAPGHIDVDRVRDAMAGTEGVVDVHDLHIWSITEGLECLSGHVVAEGERNHQDLLTELRDVLKERFGIDHITIQIEIAGCETGCE